MQASSAIEHGLVAQFLEALRRLPDTRAELDQGRAARIAVSVAGKAFTLLIEVKKMVYPRDVRELLWQCKEYSCQRPASGGAAALPVLVAQFISPGAKEVLREAGFGYFEGGGSMYLSAPGAYFYVDKPPSKNGEKSVRSVYAGRRAQVLHALLVHHRNWFGVTELARQSHVSPATASQVLTELERFDWLESRGQGPRKERHLREPAALLDAWTKHAVAARPTHLLRYFVPGVRAGVLLEQLTQAFNACGAEYAISHEAAAQCYAPFLSGISQVRARMVVGASTDAALVALGARRVDEGANLAIIEEASSDDLLFREDVGGAWLASPIQVYLDLLRGEGRAKELAEHLRHERIGF